MRKILLLLLILTASVYGATDTVYIWADTTGNCPETETCYESVRVAVNAEARDLVTATDSTLFLIQGAWSSADDYLRTENNTWVTDATYKVIIKAVDDARHSGIYCDTCHRWEGNFTAGVFQILADSGLADVVFDGLQIYNNRVGSSAIGVDFQQGGGDVTFSNIIVRGHPDNSGAVTSVGIGVSGADRLNIQNCIFYDWLGTGSFTYAIGLSSVDSAFIYNNTIDNCYRGIRRVGGTVVIIAKNNIFTSIVNAVCFADAMTYFNDSCDYNITDSADFDSMATNSNDIVDATIAYSNAAGDDYHLASGDDAIDEGQDLSSPTYGIGFSTDIDGDTRSGTWDMGADEYPAVASGVSYRRSRLLKLK